MSAMIIECSDFFSAYGILSVNTCQYQKSADGHCGPIVCVTYLHHQTGPCPDITR